MIRESTTRTVSDPSYSDSQLYPVEGKPMPVLSMFYGIVIRMYFFDDRRHGMPHVHAEYGGEQAVFNIENGDVLAGALPSRKSRLVQAWIEIHREELLANWQLAVNGEEVFKIDPLR